MGWFLMLNNAAPSPDRGFSPLQVQVFPQQPKSTMSRASALHLFRLLQRYDWCLSVSDYAGRWADFWPTLSSAERVILVYTVKAHCGGEFGRRMVIANLPVDFEYFEADTRPTELTYGIAQEFECLLEDFCNAVAGNQCIRDWVAEACPSEFVQIRAAGFLNQVFGTRAWVCPEQIRFRSTDVLRAQGLGQWEAAAGAAAMEKALFGFYEICGQD